MRSTFYFNHATAPRLCCCQYQHHFVVEEEAEAAIITIISRDEINMHSMREGDETAEDKPNTTIQKTKQSLTRIESSRSMLISTIAPTGENWERGNEQINDCTGSAKKSEL